MTTLRSVLGALSLAILLVPVAACGGPAAGPNAAATPTEVATSAASACDATAKMPDLGHDHINTLTHEYPQHPATSGPHYPVWITPPPQVFSTPLVEVRAVHNLEHGYVIVYYATGGEAALPAPIVTALAARVNGQAKVLMAPYAAMPTGKSLAFAAWDELQLCGPGVTAGDASAALAKFVAAFREGPLAPEPNAP